jgi:hypothetical protein
MYHVTYSKGIEKKIYGMPGALSWFYDQRSASNFGCLDRFVRMRRVKNDHQEDNQNHRNRHHPGKYAEKGRIHHLNGMAAHRAPRRRFPVGVPGRFGDKKPDWNPDYGCREKEVEEVGTASMLIEVERLPAARRTVAHLLKSLNFHIFL